MNAAELSPRRRRRRFLIGYEDSDLPVKREPDEDIKDYAETTMNELLGWYGYEKVDSRDTQGLNLTHFASNNNSNAGGNHPPNGVSPPSSAMEGSDASEDVASHHGGLDGQPSKLRPDSVSPGPDASSTASDEVARQHQQMVSALSSIAKHPGAPDSPNLPPGCIVCAWCQKVGMKLFTLKTPNGCKAFCSELCFTQCRRASFKKNKICDWCKHVRHTVNYVDFQDGEQQLQFCSDKCLNQYKMNIFCKETQAHLQMHTHLKEAACKMAATGSVNLITPELWLRDCKTNGNSTSPHENSEVLEDINSDENLSTIPSPTLVLETSRPPTPTVKEKKEPKQDHRQSPKEKDRAAKKSSLKHSPKKGSSENKSVHQTKLHREKKANGIHQTGDSPVSSRQSPIRASPPSHLRNSHITNGSHSLLSPPPVGSMTRPPLHINPLPPRHCPPVPSPMGLSNLEAGRQPFLHHNLMPPPFQILAQQQMEAFIRSQHGMDLRAKGPPPLPIPPWVMPPFPPVPPPPQPHLPPPLSSKSPSLSHSSSSTRIHHQNSTHKSSHHNKHKHSKSNTGHASSSNTHPTHPGNATEGPLQVSPSLLPPVTIMVPFPIVLPVPLPIPVPIPIPPEVAEKYKVLKEKENTLTHEEKENADKGAVFFNQRKRKSSHDSSSIPSSKYRRKHRISSNGSTDNNSTFPRHRPDTNSEMISPERFRDHPRNLNYKSPEVPPENFNDSSKVAKVSSVDVELESRSYSPLSEAVSSNDEDDIDKTIRNGDMDAFSNINFSSYNISLMRSSPSTASSATERHFQIGLLNNAQDFRKSPSPTNLSMKDKQHSNVSSSAVNFKKKHLREQLSLMT